MVQFRILKASHLVFDMMTVGSENLCLPYQDGKEIEEMRVVLICSNETIGDVSAVIIIINLVLRRCSL